MVSLVVVSLPKCGTNLMAGLMRELGYDVSGAGVDNKPPSWTKRFDLSFVAEFPPKTCYFLHGLSADYLDWQATSRWREGGVPRIIFNYRDPRAALVSMINYIVSTRYSGNAWQQLGEDIMGGMSRDERIEFGISYFERTLFRCYRESAWLLKHPKVLCCSFERLVGPRGGGDPIEQVNELAKIMAFADCQADVHELARKAFNPDSRTFNTGHRDTWRNSYTDATLAAFEARHGDILKTFSYQPLATPCVSVR